MKEDIRNLLKKYKEKKSQRFLQLKRPNTDVMFKAHYKAQIFLISEIMADLKKLNEAIVSEVDLCACGKELSIHEIESNQCSSCKSIVNK